MTFSDAGGPSEDSEHEPGMKVPAFLEVEPGHFKAVEKCSRGEIEANILLLTMQAQDLMEQAEALDWYLGQRDDEEI